MRAANPLLREAMVMLERAGKKQKAPVWVEASRILSGSAAARAEVNLRRLSLLAEDGQAIFVPGKVLGSGLIEKKVTVGALAFSESARSKIKAAGGSALTIELFLKKYPRGSGVKLVC